MTDDRLAPELRIAVARLARRLRQSASDGMTPSLVSALATIDRLGPLTAGDLARAEQVTPPSITAVLSRLDEQQLIDRVADPDDKRVVFISLTAAGHARVDDIRRRKDEQLDQLLATLTDDERALLAQAAPVLDRLAACETEAAAP